VPASVGSGPGYGSRSGNGVDRRDGRVVQPEDPPLVAEQLAGERVDADPTAVPTYHLGVEPQQIGECVERLLALLGIRRRAAEQHRRVRARGEPHGRRGDLRQIAVDAGTTVVVRRRSHGGHAVDPREHVVIGAGEHVELERASSPSAT
jgi:hypothetical protein